MLKMRVPLGSLQLAGLFLFFIILSLFLFLAALAIGCPLYQANALMLFPDFLRDWAWILAVPIAGAAWAFVLYRVRKAGRATLLPWAAAIVFAFLLTIALGATAFAFTRFVLILATLVVICVALAAVARRLRGLLHSLAVICASIALLLCPIEGFLLHGFVQSITVLNASEKVLDFYDIVLDRKRFLSAGNLQPNLNATLMLGDGSVGRIVTNEAGFRNETEITSPKPANEFRILFLGDSFTYGYRTDQLKTAARVLEDRLRNRAGRDVRVYPAWVQNHVGLAQWLRRYAGRFEADLILHGVCLGNDLRGDAVEALPELLRVEGPNRIPPRYMDLERFRRDDTFIPGTEVRQMRRTLRLTLILRLALTPTPISTGRAIERGAAPLWSRQNDIGLFLKDFAENFPEQNATLYNLFAANLREARDRAGATPLHTILFPQRFQQSEREWRATAVYYGLRDEAFDLDLPNRKIRAICETNDLNCYDLLPHFRERGQELLHYPYDMHWNDAGNALAGEAMAEYLAPIVAEMSRVQSGAAK